MEIALGFLIAVAIGITGVGAGIITAPVLILFFHVPPAYAVGTALAFAVAVKLLEKLPGYRLPPVGWLLVGVYMQRRQFARQAMNAGRAGGRKEPVTFSRASGHGREMPISSMAASFFPAASFP